VERIFEANDPGLQHIIWHSRSKIALDDDCVVPTAWHSMPSIINVRDVVAPEKSEATPHREKVHRT
jgi:hypothetical protein